MAKSANRTVPQYMLLGASGTLGSAIARECLRQEIELIVKTHESLDVTDLAEVRRQIQLLKPSLVINASGYTDAMEAERSNLECWNVNVRAVDNLVKTCMLADTPLIQFSDARVFGDALGNGLRSESEPLSPIGNYATSKALAETALLGLGQMICPEFWNRGFRYWLIRTSNLFGAASTDRHRNPVARLIDAASRKLKHEVPVPNNVFGTITYAPHLARAVVWLMQHHREVVSGVYHICNEGYNSLYGHYSAIGGFSERIRPRFRPAARNDVAKHQDFDARLVPYYSGLNCDKWHEIAPWRMPTAEAALREFAASLGAN